MLFVFPLLVTAQVREKQSINSGWQFVLNDKSALSSLDNAQWQKINIPHTWNALDIVDDTFGYHQGIGWYKKEIFIPSVYKGRHLELFFEGACNLTGVFVNGKFGAEHLGGFTGFRVNLDNKIEFGEVNEILVKVDNGKYLQELIPPYSGDFNLMGGIYRDVWLIVTNKTNFSRWNGNEGVLFTINDINEKKASYEIRVDWMNKESTLNYTIEYELWLKEKLIKTGSKKLDKSNYSTLTLQDSTSGHKLWSPETPVLYQLVVQLKNKEGEIVDELSQNVGFKWVGISDKNEFLLNGKPYKLKGASRHQDYKNIGNALTDGMHVRDIELMKEMGCNFLRISHYPQDPAIYDACDRLGLITWSEIPVVDKVENNKYFFQNSFIMLQEMILENYNHPSVAIWGYHNEVRNLDSISINHANMLNQNAKYLDKQRLTAMAFESNIEAPYFSNPLLKEMLSIADINGYNVYQGWYRGSHEDIGNFLDTLYAYNPKKPILLSEYGAGSITNIHTYNPTLFDFSEEYQRNFHESYVKAGNTKPWMIGFAIWNFIDFQRDGREDVVPNINKKGMVTTDRHPKDVFYYYKSQWSKEPFVYITGKHWTNRIGVTSSNKIIQIPINVYSNQSNLQLLQNGKEIETKSSSSGKFEWTVNVSDGMNNFVCKTPDEKLTDVLNIDYTLIDTTTFSTNTNWQQLNFNTGQSRTYFTDAKSTEQWMPDKRYTKGTWGYVGGEIWNTWPSNAWNGIREGIHKPIANTDNEPLFQTFVEGLSAWKADVTDGKYRVTLLLSEPFISNQRGNKERIFSINCNGQQWMQDLNLEKQVGVQSAVIIDKEIIVKDKQGITIDFKNIVGKTILNGVSIKRL
ncbi:MAG: glycoside hydrolase family 2 TIM barrel-domain containing protein [Chitinophagaceae bacterium]